MSIYIRVALAIDLFLCAVEHLSPSMTAGILPLGGNDFIQLAVLLLLGVAIHEMLTKDRDNK